MLEDGEEGPEERVEAEEEEHLHPDAEAENSEVALGGLVDAEGEHGSVVVEKRDLVELKDGEVVGEAEHQHREEQSEIEEHRTGLLLEGPSRCPVEDEVEDVLDSVGAAERPQRKNQDPHVEDALVSCFGGLRRGLHQVHLEDGPEGLNYFDSNDAEDTGNEGDADEVLEELEERGPSEEVELERRGDLAESVPVGSLQQQHRSGRALSYGVKSTEGEDGGRGEGKGALPFFQDRAPDL